MTEPRPNRVTPVPVSDGVDLHVEGHAADFLRDVIGLLAGDQDLREHLDRILDTEVHHDRHLVDTGSRDDQFIAAVLAALPDSATAIRVPGPALDRLAGTLTAISRSQGGRPIGAVPQQRTGEAAA
jgi:hypothetical protein